MSLRLTHVRLLVENYRECHRFYREVFGLTARFGQEAGVYDEFDAGDVVLALYDRGMMASVVGTGSRPAHVIAQDTVAITFSVESVDAAYDALTAMGVRFIAEPSDRPEWLLRVAHLRDPAGNLIEINGPLGRAGGEGESESESEDEDGGKSTK